MRGGMIRRLLAVGLAALVPLVVSAGPAGAQTPAEPVVLAGYRGELVDLAKGWNGAQACVVLSRAKVTCYDTTAQADAALGYSATADPLVSAAVSPSCPGGWLCLYADRYGGGRRLQFRDEYWQYLSSYGFDRTTSSWRNAQYGGDYGLLSYYNYGSSWNLPTGTYANSLGTYDNQAYRVYG